MLRPFLLLIFLLLPLSTWSEDAPWPVLYHGRFRPADAYTRLWLQDSYQATRIKAKHREAFGGNSADSILWQLHQDGPETLADAPLFHIQRARLKDLAGLSPKRSRFSSRELAEALQQRSLLEWLIQHAYQMEANALPTRELLSLSPGLWIGSQGDQLRVIDHPENGPWAQFSKGDTLKISGSDASLWDEARELMARHSTFLSRGNRSYESQWKELAQRGMAPDRIASILDSEYSLIDRLRSAGPHYRALPLKKPAGEWVSLAALNLKVFDPDLGQLRPVSNFTAYDDSTFAALREARNDQSEISAILAAAFDEKLAGKPYHSAAGKTLKYPSVGQLVAEQYYYRLPLVSAAIAAYGLALLLFCLRLRGSSRLAEAVTVFAFLIHTSIMTLRVYILGRPPVSTMYETMLYVPWISVLLGFGLRAIYGNRLLLGVSTAASLGLLVLLQVTQLDNHLENVQAVLDSQYWLIIHVLMVVGSYGVFLLASLLGHVYLFTRNPAVPRLILHSLYTGTALLITGTVLGGIWAAESWGRFWDWDPKESWAFISSCVYVIWIHLYTFRHIRELGLAVGACLGFLVISFTWYGVNYILGTGLHSYGFGSGGEGFYYAFVLADIALIAMLGLFYRRIKQRSA